MIKEVVGKFFKRIGVMYGKFRSVRLFSYSPKGMSPIMKSVYIVLNVLLVLVSTVAIGVCSLHLAYGPAYPAEIFDGYLASDMILFLNLFPPVVLFVILYALIGRGWIAYLADSTVVLGLTVANFFMLKFRNDPLMVSDIIHIREAAAISKEGYNYEITPTMVKCILVLLGFTLVMFLFQAYKPKKIPRICILAAGIVMIFATKNMYFDSDIYNNKTMNNDHIVVWSPTQLYVSKGFVYPFINSAKELFGNEPEGYDEKAAEEILSQYKNADIPEDKKVNFIGIMLEAYTDLRTLGISGIDSSVYSLYDILKEENYSGRLVTNIFAGGTIDSERAFLTGYQDLSNYRNNINSYVRYFKGQGYVTDGSHPSEDWFYNRKNVNSYLGFDNYRFLEDHFEPKFGLGARLDSNVFTEFSEIYNEVTSENDKPYFGFHVTYQGHGPYDTSVLNWGTDAKPLYHNDEASEASRVILNNYCGSIKDTSWRLSMFVQEIKKLEEPVVMVVFGDHKPWLGDGNSVYTELDISLDVSTYEGFLNYYSTEYVIIANDAAKAVLGNDFKGQGTVTSPCFLMNEVFGMMGYEGPAYMQYTDTVTQKISALNETGVVDVNGNFYTRSSAPDDIKAVINEYMNVAYYESTNFRKEQAENAPEDVTAYDYNAKYKRIMSEYSDADIPEEKKVNIVGVMLEAYSDLNTLGIKGLDSNVYSSFHALKQRGYSGLLINDVFTDGATNTERAFLTGYPNRENITANVNSHVRYFKNQGYNVDGSIPYFDWEYNRKAVSGYLGFDNYRFAENYYSEKYGSKMSLDAVVFADILENLKASAEKGDKPYFGFHVTCQGRGKYSDTSRTWGTDTNPLFENADISPEANNILNNYLGSIRDTSWRLNSFVSEIEKMKEPVVVLIFSDYKPWLGDNNSVYNELGVNLNEYSADGFLNRYATEYVIVANDAAKKALGKDLVGSGKPTSPCFLMSELFELMGLEGSAFMQYTDEVNDKILAMNHFGLIDDAVTYYYPDVVPEDLREIRDEYKFVAYYDSKQTVE